MLTERVQIFYVGKMRRPSMEWTISLIIISDQWFPYFALTLESGEDVYMHRDECVKGTCMKCKGSKISDFCPRYRQRGDENANGDPSPTCTWKTFGPVTNDSDHPLQSSRRDDANVEDYVPRATLKKQPRLVRKREVF